MARKGTAQICRQLRGLWLAASLQLLYLPETPSWHEWHSWPLVTDTGFLEGQSSLQGSPSSLAETSRLHGVSGSSHPALLPAPHFQSHQTPITLYSCSPSLSSFTDTHPHHSQLTSELAQTDSQMETWFSQQDFKGFWVIVEGGTVSSPHPKDVYALIRETQGYVTSYDKRAL